MPRPRDERTRVLGPYRHPNGWRILIVDPRSESRPAVRYFADEAEARKAKRKIEEKFALLEGTTVGQAIEEYETHQRQEGNLDKSVRETIRRMRAFFQDHGQVLARITPEQGKRMYLDFATKVETVDYHRNVLAEAKTFLNWCGDQQWVKANPLEKVEGFGKRKQGKPQLTADESTRFYEWAMWRVAREDEGALGVLMALLMGLRSSEITKRVVRDLDLGGKALWIRKGKTRKSNRVVGVPEQLRPFLVKLADGRRPDDLLFVTENGKQHTSSWLRSAMERLSKQAGVPYVCPHGLRGTNASLATEIGLASQLVADHLGHESVKTTHAHYATSASVESARQERTLKVITGGRK